jgi:hypothetical protein
MSRPPDENGQLADLLRMLPTPEPSAPFASAARHRYLAAIDARARREALLGLLAALLGLAVTVALVGTVSEPSALVVALAVAAGELALWTTGIGVVLALLPPVVWASVVLGSAATVLTLVLAARARSLTLAK